MGTDKIIRKTEYCCTRLNIPSTVVVVLDDYISTNQYNSAIEYIKQLNLTTTTEELLINCVLSYRNSC